MVRNSDRKSFVRPLLDEENQQETPLVTKLDVICFFMCAVGVAIGFSAILASLVYFKRLYGATSFLWIQLAVYGPTLPTAIVQSRFDATNDRVFGSRKAYLSRVVMYFVPSAIAIILIPYTSPDDFKLLMVLGTIVGLLSGLAYGSFYQLISIIKSDGKLQATFAMGYQGAGVFVFITQIVFHFTGELVSDDDLWYFFSVMGVLELLALVAYLILHYKSTALDAALKHHDQAVALGELKQNHGVMPTRSVAYSRFEDSDDDADGYISSPARSPTDQSLNGFKAKRDDLSFREVAVVIWPCMMSLFLTIFGNLFVFPFYTFVPSAKGAELGQILFFVKLFGDMLGRPATVLLPCIKSTTQLLVVASLRALTIPVFFVYCFTDVIPPNDWIFCGTMAVFSFSAGYVNTVCYQIAPKLLEGNGAMIANVINTVFHTAIFLALCGSFFVRFVILGEDPG